MANNSFFGKIMGGASQQQPQDNEQQYNEATEQDESNWIDETELEPEELVADEEESLEDTFTHVEVKEESNPAVISVREETTVTAMPTTGTPVSIGAPASTSTGSGTEDWFSDYDGQLNIDMYQTKDNVIIKSTIAGVKPEDLDVTVANDMVTIKGERRQEDRVDNDDYFYQECYWGNFSRSVIVPVDIDSEEIEADLKDGVLTIIIPKAAKAKTKKIRVKGA